MASTTNVVSPLGNVTGTVSTDRPTLLGGVLGRHGDAVGTERVEVTLDRAEVEHLVDGRGVEGDERIRHRTVDHRRAHPSLRRPRRHLAWSAASSARSGLSPTVLSKRTGLHDVRPGEVGLERAGHRRLRRGGEDRDEPDQPDADHQRRRRASRPLRVAHRVAGASSPLSPRSRAAADRARRRPGGRAPDRAPTRRRTSPAHRAPTSAELAPPQTGEQRSRRRAAVITVPATARRFEPAERSTPTSRSAAIGAILGGPAGGQPRRHARSRSHRRRTR